MKTAIIKNGYDLCRQILDQTRYDVSPLIQLAKKGEIEATSRGLYVKK